MNAPDPQVGFSPGVGNPNVDPQHGPRRCQKKKEAGHQKMPIAHTYSVASKKIFRLTMIAQRDQLLRWVVSSGKTKKQQQKKEWGNASTTMIPTDGFHAAAEIQPFRHQLQAILAGLAGDT